MRTIYAIIIGCLLSLSARAQESRSFSLEEAIEYGLNNSIDIRNAQIDVADAKARVNETKAMGLPQLNFQMDYTRFLKLPITVLPEEFGIDPATGQVNPDFNREVAFGVKNSFNAKLEVSALLFDGSYLVGLEAARSYTKQVDFQLDQVRDDVKNRVRNAYLPALIIAENKKILQKNISTVEKLLFETRELYKAGFVEQLDVDRLELTKANLNVELEGLDDRLELVNNALKFQMGFPMDGKIILTDDLEQLLSVPSRDDLEGAVKYSQRKEYSTLQSAVALNELNVKRYRAGYLPQLVFFGSYTLNRQGNRIPEGNWSDNSVVGVQLNLSLFDGFRKKAQIERANLQLDLVKNRRYLLEQAIDLEVYNARTNYKNAMRRLADRESNLALAEKIYNTSQVKYKEGVGSSLEITQAEQGLFQAQANYVTAKYEVLVAKVGLDEALGK